MTHVRSFKRSWNVTCLTKAVGGMDGCLITAEEHLGFAVSRQKGCTAPPSVVVPYAVSVSAQTVASLCIHQSQLLSALLCCGLLMHIVLLP